MAALAQPGHLASVARLGSVSVSYDLISKAGRARRGRLTTPHGTVELPAFMPVGTVGAVKTLEAADVKALGFEQVLANTYHLELRPGSDLIQRRGGLHKFMGWEGAVLTDSGGYQAFSLSSQAEMTEEGVGFKSHLDGSDFFLSPERAMQIQHQLGVDISMVLDHCAPYPASEEQVNEAVDRTSRWAKRSLESRTDGQAIFLIQQGGVFESIRQRSAEELRELPAEGFAIGGVSVGEPPEDMRRIVDHSAPLLPERKPRYLMGVGHPGDIIHAVECGVDLFDCVLPTRMARHGALYTMQGRVTITNAKWAEHDGPPCEGSVSPVFERHSSAYLRHLMKVGEPLGARLATLHNLWFYGRLMADIRQAIEGDDWQSLKSRYSAIL